ncbi:ABC transporter ATP-binding protein [Zhihengliuella sp.]|uniref:ABC transporter ATP-binding protein n=1 Tax=Zhihengliuella sp. TaxID=1954483 RepID=UPI002811CCFE|nr:ABC transporter ATP-binding protein [Zhihengliuella sp.]
MSVTVEEREPATMTDTALVDVENVGITFQTRKNTVEALREVDLKVNQGDFVALVGPSGCGKSTLLRSMAGIIQPTTGTVSLRGEEIEGPRQDVGFVFQRPALLPWRDVQRNIMLQAEMRGMDKNQAKARCEELLELTSLTGFKKSLPHELSGGMQQRAALCRALLHSPEILLMDEPFGALDALTREHLNSELQKLWNSTNMTVVLVTHSVAEAVYLATRVVVMGSRPGHIIEEFDVDLPRERDYEATMADPEFHRVAHGVRELLGGAHGNH